MYCELYTTFVEKNNLQIKMLMLHTNWTHNINETKQASHRAKVRAQYQQVEVEKVKTILHCPMRSKVSFVDKLFISQLKTNL